MDIFGNGSIRLTVTIVGCRTVKTCFLHTMSMTKYRCWDEAFGSWRANRVTMKLNFGKLRTLKRKGCICLM
ncbi:hypothetical protein Aduo_009840 [Ancylostoma duodenale]